ncbi:MAG TPA: NAD(P)-binding domain-containing protein [Woeseiaceae bacterium]|nr:NAD(P)-binding domain-containing protein [Woeseiaceae bacterium]
MYLYQAVLYGVPALLISAWYWRRYSSHESAGLNTLVESIEEGLNEPPTLHPEIDHTTCIGCTNCVQACPEQDSHTVLGMIGKKAHLVGPTNCIGHGACKAVCPVGAIKLVFGTSRRGVDIPYVSPTFETNVPGVFIAGELGGMGLIRNAVEQGSQAMQSIRKLVSAPHRNSLDTVIIGAGPAGFAATLAATDFSLKHVTVEQEELGGTVAHFPRRKLVMTQPANLPIVGKMRFKEVQKESLIEFWRDVESKTGITINYGERVDAIEAAPTGGFVVRTSRRNYNTRTVLIAIGRRGSPRKLGVPGEDLSKVVYRVIDPEQYRGRRVLVVGGGDSALEAATSIASEPGTTVTLSYRSGSFSRAKPKNRDLVAQMSESGRLRVLFNSNVQSIAEDHVEIALQDATEQIPNDAVVVSAGGILPSAFLRTIGIEVETKWGTE